MTTRDAFWWGLLVGLMIANLALGVTCFILDRA